MELCERKSIAAAIAPKLRMMCSPDGLAGVTVDFEKTEAPLTATVDNVFSVYHARCRRYLLGVQEHYLLYPSDTHGKAYALS